VNESCVFNAPATQTSCRRRFVAPWRVKSHRLEDKTIHLGFVFAVGVKTHRLEDKTIHRVERVVLNALFLGGTRCPQRVAPVMRARRLTFVAWLGTIVLRTRRSTWDLLRRGMGTIVLRQDVHLVERVVLNALTPLNSL
jgi:hypothetical protein